MAINQASKISSSQSTSMSTYTSRGWSTVIWEIIDNNTPTFTGKKISIWDKPYQASAITPSASMMSNTYLNHDFDMERVWVINEGNGHPRLIYRSSDLDLGIPYTHQMRYQRVIPSLEGTMNYLGITWKSLGSFYRYPDPPAPGTDGQVVEYEVGNLEHTVFAPEQNKNILVKFFASGVRDVDGAGGFSAYNNELVRRVVVTGDASAQVNFYFTEPKFLPSLNYKLSISTPSGIVDIIGSDNASAYPIRMQYNGIILGLPTTTLDDPKATNIHVVTDEGIQAFREYVEYSIGDSIYNN